MFSAKIIALFAAMAATTFASDVYSSFFDNNGNAVGGGTNFDVANGGCFNLQGAEQVSFSQGGVHGSTFDGPYCLMGYSDQCTTVTGTQQFANRKLDQLIPLGAGVAGVSANAWVPNSCP